MSKVLSALLGITDPLFHIGLQHLERAAHNPGVDVRLTADIIKNTHQKMRELGLDPQDTTGEELYHALLQLARKHDVFLAERMGVEQGADVSEVLADIKHTVDHLRIPKSVWALKSSAAKRLLKSNPPRKVMKQLGYRSIDSMLKRESVNELFAGIQLLETNNWQNSLHKKYQKLTPLDFESRPADFVLIDGTKWGDQAVEYVHDKRSNIVELREVGAIAIMPLPLQNTLGVSLTVLPLLLHHLHELRSFSTYIKHQQMSADFGGLFSRTLRDGADTPVLMAGHKVLWQAIHRHFGQNGTLHEVFGPNVQAEDMYWYRAEEVLYHLEPALHFWYHSDYVAVQADGHIISFNLMDVAVSLMNSLPYGHQSLHYMRNSLQAELNGRYLQEKTLENQVVKQLEGNATPAGDPFASVALDMEEMFA